MEEFKMNIVSENGEVTIRKGDALPLREPEPLILSGTISAVSRFLANRYKQPEYRPEWSHIMVNRDAREIRLVCDERNYYRTKITGRLLISPEFEKWNINTGTEYGAKELAEFIKMNRAAFPNKAEAMKLASELSNIKVKTKNELEKSDNNRGGMRYAISQQVISNNIPAEITLLLPLFKGENKEEIKVEIYVNASTFDVQLVSPDAQERLDESVNRIIDEELRKINEVTNNEIVIIEQ